MVVQSQLSWLLVSEMCSKYYTLHSRGYSTKAADTTVQSKCTVSGSHTFQGPLFLLFYVFFCFWFIFKKVLTKWPQHSMYDARWLVHFSTALSHRSPACLSSAAAHRQNMCTARHRASKTLVARCPKRKKPIPTTIITATPTVVLVEHRPQHS